MAFKPSIVALPVDPAVGDKNLGYPLTEIILEQPNGEGAAIPFVPNPDARDKITESVTGSDVRVVRKKLSEVEIDIDYIDAEKKAEIERLYHDARSCYLSPNVGPATVSSFPLQRSVEDFLGHKTMAGDHLYTEYHWDEVDNVFRSWAQDVPVLPIHGHWSRFFCTTYGMDNKATKPHPNSSSTGWAMSGGTSGSISYQEEVLTPALDKRGVTNGKGVTVIEAGQQSPMALAVHASDNTLHASYHIGASVCLATTGDVAISLETVAGAIIDLISVQGDGLFHLYKIGGANPGVTQARIKLWLTSTTVRPQMVLVGPVFIGSEGSTHPYPRIPDWSESSTDSSCAISSDANEWVMPEFTASFFFKYAPDNYVGFIEINGSTGLYLSMTSTDRFVVSQDSIPSYFYNIGSTFGLTEGDWCHCVVVGDTYGISLFINGIQHPTSGTAEYNPIKRAATIRIGRVGSYPLIDSGLSHVRLDRTAWTLAQAQDHMDTYFTQAGRGAVEPTFCKEMIIEDMEWEYRVPDQWVGTITMRELGPDEDFAPMQRQEDM